METAGVEPAPPRCKRGVLAEDVPEAPGGRGVPPGESCDRAEPTPQPGYGPHLRRLDEAVAGRQRGGNAVTTVVHEIRVADARDADRRSLATLLEPAAVQ